MSEFQHALRRAKQVVATLGGVCLVLLVVSPWLRGRWNVFTPPLHTTLEICAIVLFAMVFMVYWNMRLREPDLRRAIVAALFLAVAVLDLQHLLSFKGMPDWVTHNEPEKAIHFWLAARLIVAMALLLMVFYRRPAAALPGVGFAVLFGTLLLSALASWGILYQLDRLPDLWQPGAGMTSLKIDLEYALAALYAGVAFGALRALRGSPSDARTVVMIHVFAAASISACGELLLTRYVSLNDIYNLAGHVYKVAAAFYLYRGIAWVNINLPYGQLVQNRQALLDSERKLHALVEEQRQAQAALRVSHDNLRALTATLQTVREEEQKRIARELHDELGQALTTLKMDVAAVDRQLDATYAAPHRRLADIDRTIDNTVASVRRIATGLRPVMLDNLGLVPTLEWLTRDVAERSGLYIDLDVMTEDISVSGDTATAIFRIVQEALTNIVRHAGADEVAITLRRRDGKIVLRVQDNGKGFDETDACKKGSFGLLGMRERAFVLGGSLTVSPAPAGGTLIEVVIPEFGTVNRSLQ